MVSAAYSSSRSPVKEPLSPPRDPGWSPRPPALPSGMGRGDAPPTSRPLPPTSANPAHEPQPPPPKRHATGPPAGHQAQGRIPCRSRQHPADKPAPSQGPATEHSADTQSEKRGEGTAGRRETRAPTFRHSLGRQPSTAQPTGGERARPNSHPKAPAKGLPPSAQEPGRSPGSSSPSLTDPRGRHEGTHQRSLHPPHPPPRPLSHCCKPTNRCGTLRGTHGPEQDRTPTRKGQHPGTQPATCARAQ
ncbi:proline-rich protein 2-like [Corythoichthys intestinalis]|uniref:proline-rich protein 2-like n=1 Tax=Corythoichthys intestinalis TaxID=161448 RepID=UPI0025A67C07|nr:proline-rich protein 2-like [Corythoichthys intestinalis]